MAKKLVRLLRKKLSNLEASGLYKPEIVIQNSQDIEVEMPGGVRVVNFGSNNYLGLSKNESLGDAGERALKEFGYGTASNRIILGTQAIHKKLEERLSQYVGMEDTVVYNSDYDANIGLFEALLIDRDTVFCDANCHASIIDGIRLCRANRVRYRTNDLEHLEHQLKMSKNARIRMIVTDGVFSTSGIIAKLPQICELAKMYNAIVMVHDSQATGVLGEIGRGTHEHHNVMDQVDIISGSFGYALGGVNGGFVSSQKEIAGWLRQRSRPYILSNSFSPVMIGSVCEALDIMQSEVNPLSTLRFRVKKFREGVKAMGFNELVMSEHPLVCILTINSVTTQRMVDMLFQDGIFATGLCYPSVPRDQARIRMQISALHTEDHIDQALSALKRSAASLL